MQKESMSDLVHKMEDLKEKYQSYQRMIGYAKRDLQLWDPYDGLTKEQHENYYHSIIGECRYQLNHLQNEIKELRKKIKNLNRLQNEEYEHKLLKRVN